LLAASLSAGEKISTSPFFLIFTKRIFFAISLAFQVSGFEIDHIKRCTYSQTPDSYEADKY
jgi:hypothetical protein